MTELWFANLNILLKLDNYHVTIVDEFNYFIKVTLYYWQIWLFYQSYIIMTELWFAN
jgi:hypothetical protein